jgi:hypothetical protein
MDFRLDFISYLNIRYQYSKYKYIGFEHSVLMSIRQWSHLQYLIRFFKKKFCINMIHIYIYIYIYIIYRIYIYILAPMTRLKRSNRWPSDETYRAHRYIYLHDSVKVQQIRTLRSSPKRVSELNDTD